MRGQGTAERRVAEEICHAASLGDANEVKLLLNAGANTEALSAGGNPPLLVAVMYGYADVVDLLLGAGADAEAEGADKHTALMWATATEQADVVQLLVAAGAKR